MNVFLLFPCLTQFKTSDGLVGQLRLKNEALERSLRIANQTNAVLQQRLDDIELDHKKTLESMDSQIQRLYETVNILVQSNHHTQPVKFIRFLI